MPGLPACAGRPTPSAGDTHGLLRAPAVNVYHTVCAHSGQFGTAVHLHRQLLSVKILIGLELWYLTGVRNHA